MINHQNHAYSAGIPLEAGDRYYAQDLGRDFYFMQDTIGAGLLAGFGVTLGTPSLLKMAAPSVDGVTPNTIIDIPAGSAILPFSIDIPDSYAAIPPTTTTASVNMPINWGAFTIDVSTLGCTGVATYNLYASYSEVVSKTRQRAKASGTYGYEVLPTLSLGATTGSIPAGSVLLCTFTYNSGSSPITALVNPILIISTMGKKQASEIVYRVGKIHQEFDYNPPVVWDPTNPDAYLPALDLSTITDSQTIDSTGVSSGLTANPITKLVSPKSVTFLRAFKATIRRGLSTEKSAFTLSTFAVSGNTTATLVFASDTDLVAALAALNEDASVAGASSDLLTYTPDYTKSWVMNIPSNLTVSSTTIPAGDYVMTSVTSSTRTVVFTIPSTTNVSATATAITCSFYPFRIVGSTTTARIFASQGRVLQGANDGLLENVSGGRRRGRGQGHQHTIHWYLSNSGATLGILPTSTGTTPSDSSSDVNNPVTDGTNGTPRTGPETDVRSTIVHFYFGLGALEA